MNLIADIGNSYWKVALFNGTTLLRREETPTGSNKFIAEFLGDVTPDAVGFSSVRDTAEKEKAMFASFGKVYTFSTNDTLPVCINYKTPATLGTDRIAGAVFAGSAYPGKDCLVITIGSCITSDIVTGKKEYLGGTISPGPQMRLRAMHHYTGKLPQLEFNPDIKLPGKTTSECMESGAYHGVVAEVEFYIRHYRQHFPDLHVIVSGGFAPFFEKKINYPIFAHCDIVLKGLNEILNYKLGYTEK